MAAIEDFQKLDIRTGRIVTAERNAAARVPAYVLRIDFGDQIGQRVSSAQLCDNYSADELVGRTILAVVNFPPKRVAGVVSEVLVLAVTCEARGTVLVTPDSSVELGQPLA